MSFGQRSRHGAPRLGADQKTRGLWERDCWRGILDPIQKQQGHSDDVSITYGVSDLVGNCDYCR